MAQVPEQAKFGDVALLSGVYVLPKLKPEYLKLISLLRTRSFAVALDTGWPDGDWTKAVRAEALSWINHCDHVLVNELEARSLTEMPSETIQVVAETLLNSMPPNANLVIKYGPNGALARCGSVQVEIAAPMVKVVDTIGAGNKPCVWHRGRFLHSLEYRAEKCERFAKRYWFAGSTAVIAHKWRRGWDTLPHRCYPLETVDNQQHIAT